MKKLCIIFSYRCKFPIKLGCVVSDTDHDGRGGASDITYNDCLGLTGAVKVEKLIETVGEQD